ncbi:MAG: toxic anion resistance protein [Oligoflexia bacterium]|nr:toxic anion resistance protein [Oligoflexia bacterium]
MMSTNTLQVADAKSIREDLGLSETADLAKKQLEQELASEADKFVNAILKLNADDVSAKADGKLAIDSMGVGLQRQAAQQSSMLNRPVKELSKRAEDGSDVSNALINLKMEVEALDPARFDFEAGWASRIVGMLPGVGTPLKRYFSKYESAQTVIQAIVNSLEQGKEQLIRDNSTLLADQKVHQELASKLSKAIMLALAIDKKLEEKLQAEVAKDSNQYHFIAEELLFPLRQRILDLQQQLAVGQQAILAMEIIIRNNKELVRGVNRALNVTVSALQVGATVALALIDQKSVLDKVENINRTTSDLIASTAERLKIQGAQIHKQASSSQLDMESLKRAFADIKIAMDDIASFRLNALPQMAQSVLQLDQLTAENQKVIEKMQKGNQATPKITIDLK